MFFIRKSMFLSSMHHNYRATKDKDKDKELNTT